MYEGTVCRVVLPRGFGFISSPGQPDTFFHFTDLGDDLEFDDQLRERRVRFDIVNTGKGPHAENIVAAN